MLFYRSFKGNRKRPRTETGEGASAAATEGKKNEKEDKGLNGENKEKEPTKETEKKPEAGGKSTSETSREGTSTVEAAADGMKGRFFFLTIFIELHV